MYFLERLVARSLPVHDRDAVLGDLIEESMALSPPRRPGWRLWATLRIVAHYQAEPYREAGQRAASVSVLATGLAVLWLVPLASSNLFVDPEILSKPLIRVAAMVWGASHVTSAIAAGLWVGRSSLLPERTVPTHWHLGSILVAMAFVVAPGFGAGLVAALVLGGAVWVGNQARVATG